MPYDGFVTGVFDGIKLSRPFNYGTAVTDDTARQFTGDQPVSLSQYFGKHPEFLNKLR